MPSRCTAATTARNRRCDSARRDPAFASGTARRRRLHPPMLRYRSDRQPVAARADDGMIPAESRPRRGPQMSATPDSTLADPKQLVADLQRQLAASSAERDEALRATRHGQTATAEVLQVINSSPGDLAPVFDAILERRCVFATPRLASCDVRRRAIPHRRTPAVPAPLADFVRHPMRPGQAGRPPGASQRRGVVRIIDMTGRELTVPVTAAPSYRRPRRGTHLHRVSRSTRTKLLGDDRCYRQEVRPFTDKQIALLQNSRRRRSSRWRTRG